MTLRHSAISLALTSAPLLALVACGVPPAREGNASVDNAATVEVAPQLSVRRHIEPGSPTASPAPFSNVTLSALKAPLSCTAEIGDAAAKRRADLCRNVSPATHPPCNVANSCAMIDDEIARSCALFEGKGEPMKGCTPAPMSGRAAAAVVERYYAALNARDYDTAWTQWGADGPPGQKREAFRKGFARTRSTRVAIGKLEPSEGAAGSIYQTVPVVVDATLADGTRQRFGGSYTLRRVNGVDGATADQRRWHIDSAKLRPVPAR